MGLNYIPSYSAKEPSPIWNELEENGSLIKCKKCNKHCYKFWHIAKRIKDQFGNEKNVLPEMDLCAPCFFHEELNPIRVRHLTQEEITECKVLLEQLREQYDTSKQLAKENLNNA